MNEPGKSYFYLYGGVANEPMKGIAMLYDVDSDAAGQDNLKMMAKWEILSDQNGTLRYICDGDKLGGRYGFQGAYW